MARGPWWRHLKQVGMDGVERPAGAHQCLLVCGVLELRVGRHMAGLLRSGGRGGADRESPRASNLSSPPPHPAPRHPRRLRPHCRRWFPRPCLAARWDQGPSPCSSRPPGGLQQLALPLRPAQVCARCLPVASATWPAGWPGWLAGYPPSHWGLFLCCRLSPTNLHTPHSSFRALWGLMCRLQACQLACPHPGSPWWRPG